MPMYLKFKIILCALVLGFALNAPVMAVEINYTDAEQAPLQPMPLWWNNNPSSALFPGTTAVPLASGNTVTVNYITGGSLADPAYVFGGLSNTGDAGNNKVNIVNGSITLSVYGASLDDDTNGNANYNTVTISGGNVGSSVFGGHLGQGVTGNAAYNNVNIDNGNIDHNVYGGFVGDNSTGSATNNTVTISGGSISHTVFGGYLDEGVTGSANNNNVVITDGNVNNYVYGGYLYNGNIGDANNNTVTITGGSVGLDVAGGYLFVFNTGNANNNTVNIGGNATVNNVMGGGGNEQSANNNTVNLYGSATVTGEVYGAYGEFGEAKNNTVRISGMVNLTGAQLYGNDQFTTWATDGNTLVVDDYRGGSVINTVANFQNYRFIIGDNVTDTNAALKVDNAVNLTGTTVGIVDVTTSLSPGTELMLIDNTNSGSFTTYSNNVAAKGFATVYQFEYYYDNAALMARLLDAITNPQTKALNEGFLAGAVFLNQKNDLMSNWGLPAMGEALKQHPGARFVPFAVMQGGGSVYKTGSSLNVKGFSSIAGLALGINDNLNLGAFFEAGWGNYNSRNSFNNAPSIKGDGGTRYYGGGVMTRYNNIWQGLYAQGYFSMGRSEVDFRSGDMVNAAGQRAEYDSSSTYYSAHAGLGYLLDLTEDTEIDIYVRYLWNRTGRDSVTVGSDPVRFNAVDSHRAQLGARAHYNLMPGFSPYAGALWEYEFGGEAKGRIYDMNMDAPNVRGGSVMGELGFVLRPDLDAPLYIEAGVQGYAGKREGVSGTLRLSLAF